MSIESLKRNTKVFPALSVAKEIVSLILKHRDKDIDIEQFRELEPEFNAVMRFLMVMKDYINNDPLGIYPNITSVIYQKRVFSPSGHIKVFFSARKLEWIAGMSLCQPYYCEDVELYLCNNTDASDARQLRWQISNGYGLFRRNFETFLNDDPAKHEAFIADQFFPLLVKMYKTESIDVLGFHSVNQELALTE